MCRMSSKDKINVQDLSKERGVSGGVDMSEEKESSTGKSARPGVLQLLSTDLIHNSDVSLQKALLCPVQTPRV